MKLGDFIQQPKGFKAFVPGKFPPVEPFEFSKLTEQLHAKASLLVGKLDGVTQLLPDVDLFIFMYARKEAALSSEIEGTKATMSDAIRAEVEMTSDLPKDVDRILHYIKAMNQGLHRLESLSLSNRLIREVHKTLFEGTGDAPGKTPGEFRTTQNWIGGASPATARFVPPPAPEMRRSLSDWERFLHEKDNITPLIKTALMHVQFETIHPFLDGNGRVGRLLITFYLCHQGILERPVLYISEFFKKHREVYFDLLEGYHNKGEVEPWVNFFLEGVAHVAEGAVATAKKINTLREEDMAKIQAIGGLRAKSGMIVLRKLYELPIVNVRKVEEWTNLSRPAANGLVAALMKEGILVQRNQRTKYGRDFEYKKYLKLFTDETK
ncbi:MAG: Fic family protein [Candidatus Liptonbacteria bacterium]|nr:Fic family protein [Candidatus Liptonbacteria bacterium]